MKAHYRLISKSWVAEHPDPVGVIEFYGGEGFGVCPQQTYEYFLQRMFDARYTIIAVPFQIGLNHEKIAQDLLIERDIVRERLNLEHYPHFWVGHSIGCKIIFLLEAGTEPHPEGRWIPTSTAGLRRLSLRGIYNEPSLLLAPANPDTSDSVRVPLLPDILDDLGLGVRPSPAATRQLILDNLEPLFNLMAVISFSEDEVAGNLSLPDSNVAWLVRVLKEHHPDTFLQTELEGGHLEPNGIQISSSSILVPRIAGPLIVPIIRPTSRPLEPDAVNFLQQLDERRKRSIAMQRG